MFSKGPFPVSQYRNVSKSCVLKVRILAKYNYVPWLSVPKTWIQSLLLLELEINFTQETTSSMSATFVWALLPSLDSLVTFLQYYALLSSLDG